MLSRPMASPFTITATGGAGVTQVLTINTVGVEGQPQTCNS